MLLVLLAAATLRAAPLDGRHHIPSADFSKSAEGTWLSPVVRPTFAFDELIYSWHLQRTGDTFRIQLKAVFGPGDESPWLDAGFWGAVTNRVTDRKPPRFDRGVLDMDWLKLKTRATAFQFKVMAAGRLLLSAPPALSIVVTDNHPPAGAHPPDAPVAGGLPGRILDVPLRRQFDSRGQRLIDRCQSAALAAAMQYFGKSVAMEDIVAHTFDPEYDYPGIWPRVLAAAQEFGFQSRIDRFRTWAAVRQALADNKVLLCSMRMKAGECEAPPYPSMGNHIVALCGVTDDGRVVVTDSFLGKSGRGYLCQWRQQDFEKVWMQTKGGIAMVIEPPPGATPKLVKNLPPFPASRPFLTGDDH